MDSSDVVMAGWYDYRLVALSVVVAFSSAYAALDLARRVTVAQGWACIAWWAGGTVVMGIGIWAMHFTGMLAFHLPVFVVYDWPTALASFPVATAASGIAWYVVTRQDAGWGSIFIGGAVQGCGIAGLHYIAMAAMRCSAMCQYNPGIVTLSVLLAIAHSVVGLWLAFKFRNHAGVTGWWKVLGALLLGAGISVMHYTGMAAASFLRSAVTPDLSHAVSITTLGATGIGVVAVMVQALAVLTSFIDSRFSAQARELHLTQDLSAHVLRSQDEERRRIARQLHETVVQSLAALKMNLGAVPICQAVPSAPIMRPSLKFEPMRSWPFSNSTKFLRNMSLPAHRAAGAAVLA
jgi:NO-binding membrane sensor protein with MHYT domain